MSFQHWCIYIHWVNLIKNIPIHNSNALKSLVANHSSLRDICRQDIPVLSLLYQWPCAFEHTCTLNVCIKCTISGTTELKFATTVYATLVNVIAIY